jgi:hypothetical protein
LLLEAAGGVAASPGPAIREEQAAD